MGMDETVRMLIIYGTGGIGKTTLAKEVFRLLSSEACEKHIVEETLFDNQYVEFSKNLDFAKTSTNIRRNVINHWKREQRRVYILFDNIDEKSFGVLQQEFINSQDIPKNVKVVITTRTNALPVIHKEHCAYYEVPFLSEALVSKVLKEELQNFRVHRQMTDQDINQFLQQLKQKQQQMLLLTPLFLVQLLNCLERHSLQDYLDAYDNLTMTEQCPGFALLVQDLLVLGRPWYQNWVDTMLYYAFSYVREEVTITPTAYDWLLQLFTQLPPAFVSKKAVEELASDVYLSKENKIIDCLQHMVGHSFISEEVRGDCNGYRIHRTVQEQIRSYYDRKQSRLSANGKITITPWQDVVHQQIISKLIEAFPDDVIEMSNEWIREWGELIRWKIDYILCSRISSNVVTTPLTWEDIELLYWYVDGIDKFIPALDQKMNFLEQVKMAMQQCKALPLLDDDAFDAAVEEEKDMILEWRRLYLRVVYSQYYVAEERPDAMVMKDYLEELITLATIFKDDEYIAEGKQNLAFTFIMHFSHTVTNLQEGIFLLLELLTLKIVTVEKKMKLQVMEYFRDVAYRIGSQQCAVRYRKALLRQLSPVLQSHGIAIETIPLTSDDYEQAFNQLVQQLQKEYGIVKDDPYLQLQSEYDMYYAANDYPKALELGKELVQAAKKRFDEEHINIVYALQKVSDVFDETGQYPEAIEYRLQSMDILKKRGNDPMLVTDYAMLANLYWKSNKQETAKEYYAKAEMMFDELQSSMTLEDLRNNKDMIFIVKFLRRFGRMLDNLEQQE